MNLPTTVPIMRAVKTWDQSPMNGLRWCAALVCGHEIWVTRTQKPKRKKLPCTRCGEIQSAAKGAGF